MADVKTSAETAATSLALTELVRIVQGGVNKSATLALIKAAFGNGGVTKASVVGSNSGNISTTSTTFVDVTGMSASIAASVGDKIEVEYIGVWYVTSGGDQSPKVSFKINATDLTTMWGTFSIHFTGFLGPMHARACFTAASGDISGGTITAQARMKLEAAGTLLVVNSGGVTPTLTIKNFGP